MTPDGRLLKIFCLISLFAGLACLGLGGFLLVGNLTDPDAAVTALEGLLATVFGVRCSILANVPSNTAKIRRKAAILFAVTAVVLGVVTFMGFDVVPAQLAFAGALVAVAVAALVLAHRIVKAQLRK